MKKILMSVSMLAFIGVVVAGATGAFFTDTATSTGNTFTAGTMEFNIIDPTSNGSRVFNVASTYPGDVQTGYLVVANESQIPMKFKAWLSRTPSTNGNLYKALKVRVTLNPSDYTGSVGSRIKAGPTNHAITSGNFVPMEDFLSNPNAYLNWGSASGGFMPNWAAIYKLEVQMDPAAGNEYQGDTFTGDINFYATQLNNTNEVW